jgi:hypothetical protein
MHIAIRLVPTSLLTSASFCPTNGSSAALAKWNSTATPAKISSGGEASSTAKPEGACSARSSNLQAARHVIVDRLLAGIDSVD